MLKTLKHARLDNSYEAELRKLLAVDLLVLDDFAIDVLDPTESRDSYDILTERHRAGSIIVTIDGFLDTLATGTGRRGSSARSLTRP
jgi:DNA replication protein DnaC